MEKLTLLCSMRTGEHEAGIANLIQILTQDISVMNRHINKLKNHVSGRGQDKQHSAGIVTALQRKLGMVSTDFKDCLETQRDSRPPVGEAAGAQQQSVGAVGPSSVMRSRNRAGGSMLQGGEQGGGQGLQASTGSGGGEAIIEMGDQGMMMMDAEQQKRKDRDKVTQSIQKTISELGGIFGQMAEMVAVQGDMLTRIDENVSDTAFNVEGAHTEIGMYYKSIASNRALILKVFAALLLIFTFFIVFR